MKKLSLLSAIATTACLTLLISPAMADPGKGKGNGGGKGKGGPSIENPGKGKDKDKDKDKEPHGNPGKGNPGKGDTKYDRFDDHDCLELRNFFAPERRSNLPPGLQKNLERGKPLPPGWEKKLSAGQIIDRDWLDLMAPVSYDYFPNVRRTPGTRLYYHDNRLVRVNEETRVILDVINLLMR